MTDHFDLLIRNGTVIDGTGAAGVAADVAVRGDRIVRMGSLGSCTADEAIDAGGLIVAPGFIDAHTHDDRMLLADGNMVPKVSQGVTTVVAGNCGISLAPMPKRVSRPVVPPLDLLDDTGEWYRYRTFAEYVSALQETPAAVNSAIYVGHTTLRAIVMDELDRPATAQEIERMQELVAEAMEAGAIGVSTGLAYPPAIAATTAEVIEVCRPMVAHNGIHATHMRDEGVATMASLDETFTIGRTLGVQTLISHHKLAGAAAHGQSVKTLEVIADEMERQKVSLDCYPYTASSTILTLDHAKNSGRTLVTWSRKRPEFASRDLSEIIEELNCSVEEAVAQLQPAGAVYFRMHDEDVDRILAFEPTMIGSDGLPHDEFPHPRLWGTFPRVLGHYSRDKGLLSLEAAVHKMTGLTASEFGFHDRGVIREGAFADITLFDPDLVCDRATFEEPTLRAEGIHSVLVNGIAVWQDNASTGRRPGQVLRRFAEENHSSQGTPWGK
ncbi:probable n-acyl-d-glutamate deacylase protein [Pseudooceanicola batsensis HTCC2597]|uniref:Probable n-acyl-d-glutamate deacylase protein n=1 Tax=Pseudooceanicola batsensis (strain ATCC BAA-863 / DSM 15984 / KCTC 12145 / HTCC2597) TaxID=252305 RepID=A3U1A4_PSEBH|nr:D-aminoacylase [Pseudooceanicola batsensis]EAQ02087.1 probable n-acyl-d-glutamate deacylase protein [Pseudooceanicola batsensis HTCC2597]